MLNIIDAVTAEYVIELGTGVVSHPVSDEW
mgnify:CR=1 FL=1